MSGKYSKYLTFFLIILFTSQSFADTTSVIQNKKAEYMDGLVLFNGVRIRKDKNTDSQIIHYISKDERIRVIEKSENKEKIEEDEDFWYKIVSSNGNTGWVFGAFIIVEEKIPEFEAWINEYAVNVRDYFGLGNKIIHQVQYREKFKVIAKTDKKMKVDEEEDYWYKVKLSHGKSGWMFGSLLITEEKIKKEEEVPREKLPRIIR